MRVRNDFVALLVNVDQMIEAKKERYRYTMYEAMESVVFVHVDDFYVIKIRERYSISKKNSINRGLHFFFFYFFHQIKKTKEKGHLRIWLIMMMTRCSILLLRL